MENKQYSDSRVPEEMHHSRVQKLVEMIIGKLDSVSQAEMKLMSDCWFNECFNLNDCQNNGPLSCKPPENGDRLLQATHCHFEKTPCWDCWAETSLRNLGMRMAPTSKWNRWCDVYKMRKWPRGQCIIIANIVFDGLSEAREGCLEDVKRMRELFSALHFDCVVATNLTAKEVKALLKWAADEPGGHFANVFDCLIVVLMSHGKENHIYGADHEPLHLYYDVYERFNDDNCPKLKGKPKLFFVQACRGECC